MTSKRRRILLLQLPIPQPGMEPARGNVPLAAGYLAMYARGRGLETAYDIEILPAAHATRLGDAGLVEAILARAPWMVGFTCYLWNVERTLWVAEQLKARRPELRVIVGGPEITADNAWVLESPHIDFAALGEGEQTFAELLATLAAHELPPAAIPGLYVSRRAAATAGLQGAAAPLGVLPPFRQPLASLDEISSPYLAGILDAADERMLLLETIRGCIFKCKFCYYPKAYDDLYWLAAEKIVANLRHARERGAEEVILLDPTLNQRRDFAAFLRLLAECNPDHDFTYFGELRAEGIDTEIATLLRAANFTEVEIGLQSVDPRAQTLMDRRNNMRAYERGVRAMLDAGLHVKIDLIVGLPGDTPDTVRDGIRYVRDSGAYSEVQVFNLAVLPGTAFREEAAALGLQHQPRPPYYVLRTPTMDLAAIYALMAEAEAAFGTEFDALPPPRLDLGAWPGDPAALVRVWRVDLDQEPAASPPCPPAARRAQAFTLWLRSSDFTHVEAEATRLALELLADNPHTTLQIVLEPTGDPRRITPDLLERLLVACSQAPTYLDRYYSVLPGPVKGTKRLAVVVPHVDRESAGADWIAAVGDCATLAWRGAPVAEDDLGPHEYFIKIDASETGGLQDHVGASVSPAVSRPRPEVA